MRRYAVALMLVVAAICVPAPAPAHAEVRWICSAATTDDACDGSLATTVTAADGRTEVSEPRVPADPPVDCFYVYPTVSNQPGRNATQTPDPEVVSIVRQQAARFSQRCRVFVPLYRQNTVAGIFAGGFTDESREIAYGDVLEAFEAFLRDDNHGRGIVLIGHSQGAGVLRRLIAETFDREPALRQRLVAAYLLGGNVLVKAGGDRGGDFAAVPLCGQAGQTGCVVAYSTFNDVPPDDTRFGKPPARDRLTGKVPPPGVEVACTNPASLFGNAETEVHPILRAEPFAPGLIAAGIVALYGGPQPTADTPYLVTRDRYVARCERVNGSHVLLMRGLAGARTLHPSPDATWGLHLVDVNGTLGDLVGLLGTQTRAFLRPRLQLRSRIRIRRSGQVCSSPRVRAVVTGAIRRIQLRIAGRRVVTDGAAPFTVGARLRRGRVNRIRVRVLGTDGRTRTLTRRVRAC